MHQVRLVMMHDDKDIRVLNIVRLYPLLKQELLHVHQVRLVRLIKRF